MAGTPKNPLETMLIVRIPRTMEKHLAILANGRNKTELVREFISQGLKKEKKHILKNLETYKHEVNKI